MGRWRKPRKGMVWEVRKRSGASDVAGKAMDEENGGEVGGAGLRARCVLYYNTVSWQGR